MRFVQRLDDADGDVDDRGGFQRPAANSRRKRLTFHILHCNETDAFGLANLVDVRNVSMQRRCGLCFTHKPHHALLIGRDFRRQHLQRHRSSFVSVARYTSPIPPAPIFLRIRKCEKVLPITLPA